MDYRELGMTGFAISELGMGAVQLTRLPWKESIDVIHGVRDLGVNWFDTARGYFDSELRLGEALNGRRDKVFIISKSGSKSPDIFNQHLHESLQRLRTDYIDAYFFHGAGAVEADCFWDEDGLLETAKKGVKAGKIRFLGFSVHRTDLALKALDVEELRIAMVPANFLAREYIDGDFMKKARERDVAVIAMKPFGGGRIPDAGVCLRFLRQYPDVMPCIGIEKTDEMRRNIAIWETGETLRAEDRKKITVYEHQLGTQFCRGCGYCLPCPQEIPISTVAFLKIFAKQMPRDQVVTESHTRAVERTAGCTECRQCVERCPYDLDIPSMLKDNCNFYERFRIS